MRKFIITSNLKYRIQMLHCSTCSLVIVQCVFVFKMFRLMIMTTLETISL
ncbi:Hypothetical protein C248_1175 [Staphylococcus aureus 08BA02176]|nr:Hypothetical protein C248_1175 [Staphylococcus aureus 08BA02176]